jgi:hypothetical protein
MKYQDLGGPTPTNYRPDDNSAKLSPSARQKVDMVCSVFHRKWQRDREKKVREVQENLKTLSDSMSLEEGNKKKRKKSRKAGGDSRDNSFEVSSDTKRDDNENLIMVGGIAGYDEETKPRVKSYKEFREQLDLFLEKKNRNKKRSRNPGTVDEDPRSKKIKKLKNDDAHWRGLE